MFIYYVHPQFSGQAKIINSKNHLLGWNGLVPPTSIIFNWMIIVSGFDVCVTIEMQSDLRILPSAFHRHHNICFSWVLWVPQILKPAFSDNSNTIY